MLINWNDVVTRYPELARANIDATMAGSHHLPHAEAELNGKLAPGFTVPFSTNNLTAVDLVTDLVYARIFQYSAPDKAKTVRERIDERCARLLKGLEDMSTSSGTLHSNQAANGIWSSTAGYTPAFGMDPTEDQCIDPDRVQDDLNARD